MSGAKIKGATSIDTTSNVNITGGSLTIKANNDDGENFVKTVINENGFSLKVTRAGYAANSSGYFINLQGPGSSWLRFNTDTGGTTEIELRSGKGYLSLWDTVELASSKGVEINSGSSNMIELIGNDITFTPKGNSPALYCNFNDVNFKSTANIKIGSRTLKEYIQGVVAGTI